MAGVGPNVEDCLTEAATLDIEATPDGTVREIQEAGGLDRVDTQARWFSLRASTKANRKAISRTKRYGDMEWDTFLSYRVDADAELVKELYWQLRNMTITEHQKTRPLRVFWDRECLKDGEKWEEGFAKAICSSRLIVPVMSRNTFKMEKTRQSAGHNVEALTEDSPADNVLLEYELGLCLNELQGTAMMPLFVGDKDDSGKFSHFFESKCLPACGEVTVKIISEKVANYLARVAGVAREDLSNRYKPRSVRKILSEVTQFQGFFLQGPTYEAVRGAVVKVHACTNRLAQEHAERQQLDHLQFSTAQGEEVCQFLAEKTLSCYGSVLAKNRLSSLRKVSQLTLHQLDTLHQEFCAASSVAEDSSITQLGRRVALGEAVESLKGDPRTKTLKEQLDDFSDPNVSGLNLVNARNQAEVLYAKKYWLFALIAIAMYFLFHRSILGVVSMTHIQSKIQLRSQDVTAFTVQLSNGSGWSSVQSTLDNTCNNGVHGICVFRRESKSSDEVTVFHFPVGEKARFVRILPEVPIAGGDMRLGILGDVGKNNLIYQIVNPGPPGKVWLQHGCNNEGSETDSSGQWSSPDSRIGQVQCCLPNVSVCTRDGCLSGDWKESGDGQSPNKTFYEAKALCEAKGWRLCTRNEMNEEYSSGCCTSKYTKTTVPNKCGYDERLVWTSDMAGLQVIDGEGRVDSDRALENVRQVTVDLGEVQTVRGIRMQGGVHSKPYSDGPACVVALYYIPLVCGCAGISVMMHFWKSPLFGVRRVIIPLFLVISASGVVFCLVIAFDPSVPGILSTNQICPSSISGEYSISRWFGGVFCMCLVLLVTILLHLVRPQRPIIGFAISLCVCVGLVYIMADPQFSSPRTLKDLITAFSLAGIVPLVLSMLTKLNERRAKKRTDYDVERYEVAWAEATCRVKAKGAGLNRSKIHAEPDPEQGSNPEVSLIDQHLQAIKKTCAEMILKLQESREQVWSDSAKAFSLWARFLFWIRADGLGPYARTGKIRQSTACIDSLFEQAAILNDDFFALLEGDLGIGDQFPSGLKWQNVGATKPEQGRELDNAKLADALMNKTEFTEQEWNNFGITDLRNDHVVKSGATYLQPVIFRAELCRGPVKRPDRALQKVVRRFYRDPRCLTDIVRCCILLESIADVRKALDALFKASTIHWGHTGTEKEKSDLGHEKWFRICKVKDRFTTTERTGYRDVCLNLQVSQELAHTHTHNMDNNSHSTE